MIGYSVTEELLIALREFLGEAEMDGRTRNLAEDLQIALLDRSE